jgi:hypothetical protein
MSNSKALGINLYKELQEITRGNRTENIMRWIDNFDSEEKFNKLLEYIYSADNFLNKYDDLKLLFIFLKLLELKKDQLLTQNKELLEEIDTLMPKNVAKLHPLMQLAKNKKLNGKKEYNHHRIEAYLSQYEHTKEIVKYIDKVVHHFDENELNLFLTISGLSEQKLKNTEFESKLIIDLVKDYIKTSKTNNKKNKVYKKVFENTDGLINSIDDWISTLDINELKEKRILTDFLDELKDIIDQMDVQNSLHPYLFDLYQQKLLLINPFKRTDRKVIQGAGVFNRK